MHTELSRKTIEEIKSRVNTLEIIGSRIRLRRGNRALCPFHKETRPSFVVNAEGRFFKCHGCGVGGDVIKFLQLYEKKTFMEVLRELASQVGIRFESWSKEMIEEFENQRRTHDILGVAAEAFHRNLPERIREYLLGRGITEESIACFQIGWADRKAFESVTASGVSPEDLRRIGLSRENDRPLFENVITIPYFEAGEVTLIRARTSPDKPEKAYFHIRGYEVQLFNTDALRDNEGKLILTEGELDCIMAVQNGFPAVGVPGVNSFNSEWVRRFDNVDIVYIVFDADDPGREGAERTAQMLGEKALIVDLPEEGQDVSDFFNSGKTAQDFRELLDTGQTFMAKELARIKRLPENQRQSNLRRCFPYLAQLGEVDRQVYRERLRREFKFPIKAFDAAIKQAEAVDGEDSDQNSLQSVESAPEMTAEETSAAEELLRSPDLLRRFVEDTVKLGCVGEEDIKVLIYLALTSRMLEEPISLIIKGDSASGKSFLVGKVCEFFPPGEILQFSAISPKALYHRKDSLEHKALVVFERPGAEESDYPIRTFQSEKKLIFSFAEKNPDTQRIETKDVEVKGPIAYIETTTRVSTHPENESRCFQLFVDESEEQTRRILEAQKRKYLGSQSPETDMRLWQNVQRQLKPYHVVIPYANLIEFPTTPVRSRRDHLRFLNLIEVSALLHQYQRGTETMDGRELLAADYEDYAIAYELASTVLQQTMKAISPSCEELMCCVGEMQSPDGPDLQEQSCEKFKRGDLRTKLYWDRNKVARHLKEACRAGLLEIVESGKGKATIYRFVKMPDKTTDVLLHPEELRRRFEGARLPVNLPEAAQIPIEQVNQLVDNALTQPAQVPEGAGRNESDSRSQVDSATGESTWSRLPEYHAAQQNNLPFSNLSSHEQVD